MNPQHISYKPKQALIFTPVILIIFFISFFLISGSFRLDMFQIIGLFAAIYYIILLPILLKLSNILISKNMFIFPFMWLGSHITLGLIWIFINIFQNIYQGQPFFEYIGLTIRHNVLSISMLILSFISALIFWICASLLPRLKVKSY